jgi:hypothetical protein
MEDSDCSESCIIGYDSSSSRRGPAAELMANSELSRLPDKERIHMPAPTTTQSWTRTRDFARTHVAFRQVQRRRRSELITTFRGSISRPVYAPTDASPPVSRPTAHGLGSIWFAKPCIVRDFHSVFFASFSGASGRGVKPLASLVRSLSTGLRPLACLFLVGYLVASAWVVALSFPLRRSGQGW